MLLLLTGNHVVYIKMGFLFLLVPAIDCVCVCFFVVFFVALPVPFIQ